MTAVLGANMSEGSTRVIYRQPAVSRAITVDAETTHVRAYNVTIIFYCFTRPFRCRIKLFSTRFGCTTLKSSGPKGLANSKGRSAAICQIISQLQPPREITRTSLVSRIFLNSFNSPYHIYKSAFATLLPTVIVHNIDDMCNLGIIRNVDRFQVKY